LIVLRHHVFLFGTFPLNKSQMTMNFSRFQSIERHSITGIRTICHGHPLLGHKHALGS
jgi:hypothetical protein